MMCLLGRKEGQREMEERERKNRSRLRKERRTTAVVVHQEKGSAESLTGVESCQAERLGWDLAKEGEKARSSQANRSRRSRREPRRWIVDVMAMKGFEGAVVVKEPKVARWSPSRTLPSHA